MRKLAIGCSLALCFVYVVFGVLGVLEDSAHRAPNSARDASGGVLAEAARMHHRITPRAAHTHVAAATAPRATTAPVDARPMLWLGQSNTSMLLGQSNTSRPLAATSSVASSTMASRVREHIGAMPALAQTASGLNASNDRNGTGPDRLEQQQSTGGDGGAIASRRSADVACRSKGVLLLASTAVHSPAGAAALPEGPTAGTAFVVPVYPAHYAPWKNSRTRALLVSAARRQIRGADFWFVLTSLDDQRTFCEGIELPTAPSLRAGTRVGVICLQPDLPPQDYQVLHNWTASKGFQTGKGQLVTFKKWYGVHTLLAAGHKQPSVLVRPYPYLVAIDAEVEFTKKRADVTEALRGWWGRKRLVAGWTSNELIADIMQGSATNWFHPPEVARLAEVTAEFRAYFWFSNPPIYEAKSAGRFFARINFSSAVLWKMAWTDFDHLVYGYFLLLEEAFELRVLDARAASRCPSLEAMCAAAGSKNLMAPDCCVRAHTETPLLWLNKGCFTDAAYVESCRAVMTAADGPFMAFHTDRPGQLPKGGAG